MDHCVVVERDLSFSFPITHMLYQWLQHPDKVSGLRLFALVGALVAHERHGNSRAIRSYWRLFEERKGHLLLQYACFSQGSLLVLERTSSRNFVASKVHEHLEERGPVAGRAVYRYLTQENPEVGVALVPITLGRNYDSVVTLPDGYYVGIRLRAQVARPTVLPDGVRTEWKICCLPGSTSASLRPRRRSDSLVYGYHQPRRLPARHWDTRTQ